MKRYYITTFKSKKEFLLSNNIIAYEKGDKENFNNSVKFEAFYSLRKNDTILIIENGKVIQNCIIESDKLESKEHPLLKENENISHYYKASYNKIQSKQKIVKIIPKKEHKRFFTSVDNFNSKIVQISENEYKFLLDPQNPNRDFYRVRTPFKGRIVSGIQPTGSINIGTYIGSVKNFVKLQDKMPEYEFFIFIADLHAITIPKDKQVLRGKIKELAALYVACGLDPDRVNLFIQSEIAAHSQLAYLLQCNSYIGELERMVQYKEKSKKQEKGVTVGLFSYPTLMAADILLYDPQFVPVGVDQKQHLELTRDIAQRVNNKYNDLFVVPEPMIAEVGAKIMSLTDPTSKMSKSDNNEKSRINLLDPENIIKKRIKSAITDSLGTVAYDPINRPGISNLMTIYSVIEGSSFEEIQTKYEGKGYKEFKEDLGDIVYQELKPIQERYKELINSSELDDILDKGRDVASRIAYKKIMKFNDRIGLGRKRR